MCVYTLCICIHIHRHTYIHIHTYAHAHIHAYMHTHIHIYVHAHLYTDRKSQQQHLDASNNIIDAHTHPYACIYTYMHIHICAQPAANVLQMCMLISKEHLYNAYSCACTGAQNTCSKEHATFTAEECTYINIHTHICIRIHMHKNTCAHL